MISYTGSMQRTHLNTTGMLRIGCVLQKPDDWLKKQLEIHSAAIHVEPDAGHPSPAPASPFLQTSLLQVKLVCYPNFCGALLPSNLHSASGSSKRKESGYLATSAECQMILDRAWQVSVLAPIFSLLSPQPQRPAANPSARVALQLAPVQAAWYGWQLGSLQAFVMVYIASQQRAVAVTGEPQRLLCTLCCGFVHLAYACNILHCSKHVSLL